MNPTCKSNLEHLEDVQQYWVQQRNLSLRDQIESKLAHLQMFIQQLEQEPSGKDELNRRVEIFGDCKRMPGESTPQFFARLRRWLDRNIED